MKGLSKITGLLKVVLAASLLMCSCANEKSSHTQFVDLSSDVTQVEFANTLSQDEDFNIIEYLYFYNGGGVSAGDINNDGLVDLYFTANQLPNKLYLNKGDFRFEDITDRAGVTGSGNWKTGTTMADVNGDGFLDLFLCGVGNYKKFDGGNQLLINNGDLTFTDRTAEYGLSFKGFSTHAAFFDYDNDGDLDMYLLNHSVHTSRSYGHSRLRFQSDPFAGDKLYRNELIPDGKIGFKEVTSVSGIYNSQVAYGLGVGISDLNVDGFMDIYVSNDFHENDYLYINRGDGTFREGLAESVPHVSRFSMGNDIADINNDALPDIITLDMLPRDEEVIKTTAGEEPYDIYQFKLRFGYHHQFARNTLQLNRGFDDQGRLLFSDIAALAGVEASDWSWAPLLADFDNDGYKDLFIANGIATRPNDLDYINFIATDSARKFYDHKTFIKNMPAGDVPNLFFRNEGNLRYKDVSGSWIGAKSSLTTGAAYADLDNDGDLDLILNNINDKASIFRNDAARGKWLQVELVGRSPNRFGIGAKVIAYSGTEVFFQEQSLSRGWQSSVSPVLQLGVGQAERLDSVLIVWPGNKSEKLVDVASGQRIRVEQENGTTPWMYAGAAASKKTLLKADHVSLFTHRDNDFNAFNNEKLIPHSLSTQGPKISAGDLNGDGLEDFFIGGGPGQSGAVFLQDRSGNFSKPAQPALELDSASEDIASTLADIDGNGTLDLVVVSGGQEFSGEDPRLFPRLYINPGSGIFRSTKGRLPPLAVNASCVTAGDVDGDGATDLFIGGRVVPGQYGKSPRSYLLLNDGQGNFRDESFRLPQGNESGMVTDAKWVELNGDERPDLVLVGEWMPITVLIQNSEGQFQDRTIEYGLKNTNGWWNTIDSADFDGDGDPDLAAGNMGWNSRLRPTQDQPVTLYAVDLDNNGGTDHLLTYFNQGQEHPFISRDQLVKQVPSFRRDFLKYKTFGDVRRKDIISTEDSSRATVNQAYTFSSVYLENRGGTFVITPLPVEAQMFPVFAICAGDFNDDGFTDLLATGNLLEVQPDLGRYDAGYGLMLSGNGKGSFETIPFTSSGFLVKGEGRDIKLLRSAGKRDFIVVSRNNGGLLLFR